MAVISGNFTQRGETSIVNKWAKAYMAICGGADLSNRTSNFIQCF